MRNCYRYLRPTKEDFCLLIFVLLHDVSMITAGCTHIRPKLLVSSLYGFIRSVVKQSLNGFIRNYLQNIFVCRRRYKIAITVILMELTGY